MAEEQSAYEAALPKLDWTTLEDAIRDVECLGSVLTALGTAPDPVEQEVVHWLGVRIAEAGERLRAQLHQGLAEGGRSPSV